MTLGAFLCLHTRADQIEMQNGDRYNGKVLSVSNEIIVLQSDILGSITIPRAKVTKISLGTAAVSPQSVPASTNSVKDGLSSLRQSGGGSEAEKVKQQFLADADPAAKAKFDEMMNDLLSGKMSIADLRAQAKSAADQLRSMKKELGPEADSTLDSYLSILDSFLKEVPAADTLPAKTPPPSAPAKSSEDKDE